MFGMEEDRSNRSGVEAGTGDQPLLRLHGARMHVYTAWEPIQLQLVHFSISVL